MQMSLSIPLENFLVYRNTRKKRFKSLGIRDIGSIPIDATGLLDVQRRVRSSVISGVPYAGSDLAGRLAEITIPASFLDFEAIFPAVPVFVGTRPYQHIPFQWSLHVRESDGSLSHREYLHDGDDDPRQGFITGLLDAVPASGSVVVYSGYEERILRQLAAEFPQYGPQLIALAERLVDLLQIVRDCYYHPDFHGSFSIKSVAPTLAPQLSYDELDIPDGLAASAAYQRLLTGDVPPPEAHKNQRIPAHLLRQGHGGDVARL